MKKKPLPQEILLQVREFFGDSLAGAIILDRQGRVAWANECFFLTTDHDERSVLGRPLLKMLIKPPLGHKAEVLSRALRHASPPPSKSLGVIILPGPVERAAFEVPREQENGIAATIVVQGLGKGYRLVKFKFHPFNVSRFMGRQSDDLFVTVDGKGRVVAANERFLSINTVPNRRMFFHTLDHLLLRPRPFKPVEIQKKTGQALVDIADGNKNPWEKAYECDFTAKNWKSSWILHKTLRASREKQALRVECRDSSTYLIFKEPFDTMAFDLRWEWEMEYRPGLATSAFFNGWRPVSRSDLAAPHLFGYALGTAPSAERGRYCFVKRNLKQHAVRKLPLWAPGRRVRMRAEKSGGVFRLFINGQQKMEFTDPQFGKHSGKPYTGLIFSSFPARLFCVSLWKRTAARGAAYFSMPDYDAVFKSQPEAVYESEFTERRVESSWFMDIFFHNVTHLRRAQAEKDEALAQKKKALDQINLELRMASSVLNRLLPVEYPDVPTLRFHSYYKPSSHVGGDLFDVFKADGDNVAVLMYDVSGHGVPAALVSVMTKAIFQKTFRADCSLLDLMNAMNRELVHQDLGRDLPGGSFVTIFLGLLNHRTHTLRYIGAGFSPPVLLKDRGITLLETHGLPLGMNADLSSHEMSLPLYPGSKLVLYTDGLFEIFNAGGEFFGRQRLEKFIQEKSALPMGDLIKAVVKAHMDFTRGTPAQDDVALLGIEFSG